MGHEARAEIGANGGTGTTNTPSGRVALALTLVLCTTLTTGVAIATVATLVP